MKTALLRIHLLLPLCLVLILAASCAKRALPPPIQLSDFPLERVIAGIKAQQSSVTSLRGMAKIRIETPKEKLSFKQATVVEEPEVIELEALTLFGITLGKLSYNGGAVELVLRKERLIFDRAEKINLAILYPGMPITIGIEELRDLLLARLPKAAYPTTTKGAALSADGGLLVIKSRDADSEETLWLKPATLAISRAEVRLPGSPTATYEFGKFVEVDNGVMFPLHIKVNTEGYSLSIKYASDTEINTAGD